MEKGERLEWKMRLSRSGEGNLMLGVDYEDGSVAVAERDFRSDRNPTLKLVSDTGKMVRRIYGVLSVPRNAMPVYTDSIVLLRLPFDSTEYRNTWAQKRYNAPNQRVAPALKADSVASDTAAIDSVKESKYKDHDTLGIDIHKCRRRCGRRLQERSLYAGYPDDCGRRHPEALYRHPAWCKFPRL